MTIKNELGEIKYLLTLEVSILVLKPAHSIVVYAFVCMLTYTKTLF